jgi:O-succinylbenzoic acid--CoA ligase
VIFAPIHSATQKHSHQIAFDDGVVQISYEQLKDALSQTRAMQLSGLQPAEPVAWCPRNDLDAFLTFWALQLRGCVACPISHRLPAEKRDEVVDRIDAKWLSDYSEMETRSTAPAIQNAPVTIILSSGSTGMPKAVVHSMEAHVASAKGAATNMPLVAGDRWMWSLPLYHVSGLSILVRCAVAGATVVGMREHDELTAELLDARKVSHLSVVPTQLRRLLADESFPSKHLQWVLLGGSSIDAALVAEARNRGVKVLTTYGLTEAASQVTTSTPKDDPARSGRVLPGRELKISDSGEILIRGETLCLGYYDVGAVEPVVDDQGWFHTKDLGCLDDDGQLSVKGRIDNMFISGGENIYPESIERAMLSAFDILQVVVVPKKNEAFGARPVAFVNGTLSPGWQSKLGLSVQSYEIPVEIFDWPEEGHGAIKPDRRKLQALVESTR